MRCSFARCIIPAKLPCRELFSVSFQTIVLPVTSLEIPYTLLPLAYVAYLITYFSDVTFVTLQIQYVSFYEKYI